MIFFSNRTIMERMDIPTIRRFLQLSRFTAFLGGAGVSTSSGIPDFRSPKGLSSLYKEYGVPYETILSHAYFLAHPESFYSFYWKHMVYEGALPCLAHKALAKFEKSHPMCVITQNIDGLHEAAGSKSVLPIHGSVWSYSCLRCHHPYTLEEIPHDGVPHCHCGGIIRPEVTLYGESLNGEVLDQAVEAMQKADVLLVGGTSLRVSPANALPRFFKGKLSVLINKEETPMDSFFDVVIRKDVGTVLLELLG